MELHEGREGFAVGYQAVGGGIRVRVAEGHAADEGLGGGDAEMGADDGRVVGDGGLGAGVEAMAAGGDHNGLEDMP